MLERLASDKHSSLMGPFVSYKQNEVLMNTVTGVTFTALHSNGPNKSERLSLTSFSNLCVMKESNLLGPFYQNNDHKKF